MLLTIKYYNCWFPVVVSSLSSTDHRSGPRSKCRQYGVYLAAPKVPPQCKASETKDQRSPGQGFRHPEDEGQTTETHIL